ncbi:MAG: lytic transglycosylase domain-containing protein [Daejeonella sp.]|nr:lytic transglycosylase domain-containing protein [Daejeonella sp.]
MIKKHLITCSVMLGLLLTAKMFIYSTPATFDNYLKTIQGAQNDEFSIEPYFNTLSFANETLPLGDQRIKLKMNAILSAHSYEALQTSKLHRQAEKWFPIIEPILKQYGIPADFKYVPLVESGLQGGTSPKGASGYWQFMPQTARDFGLKVNTELDERQNIRKSSVAAAKYIKSLYREFNSWTLAAAAYNIGEGSLKRQMHKQSQDNYYKMKLNRETASYVYKLISMKEIIENPTRYGYNNRASRLLANANAESKSLFDANTGRNNTSYPQILKN